MESVQDTNITSTSEEAEPRKVRLILGQFNWRMILIRILVNALTLIVISLVLPDIYFADKRLLNVLFLGAMLGVLNAFVKPVIQFLTLPFIFATYGFVVVGINALMLLLLAAIFPERFVVDRLIWALIGGALMGLLAAVLESLFGMNLPISAKRDLADFQGGSRASQPNPVESLLLGGLNGREEPVTVSEQARNAEKAQTAAIERPAADSAAEAELAEEALNQTNQESGAAPEEGDTSGESRQPGDEG